MIRPFVPADVAALVALGAQSLPSTRWREADYLRLAVAPGGLILVAEPARPPAGAHEPALSNSGQADAVAGFAAFERILTEAELYIIAVAPEHCRKGIGRALLEEGILKMKEAGARRLFLEVRPSNLAALAFYASTGFKPSHVRRDYYHDPDEDAVVMARVLA